MAKYGILRSSTNTGSAAELISVFSAPLSVVSVRPALVSDTLTLKRKGSYSDIQRWEITAGLSAVENPYEQFVHQLTTGLNGRFYIRMPQMYRAKTVRQGLALTATAAYAASTDTLILTSLGTEILPVGEYIKFANHSKVYLVTASSLVSGKNVISVFPKLVQNVAINEAVSYGERVTMTAMYADSTDFSIRYSDGILVDYPSISLVESL